MFRNQFTPAQNHFFVVPSREPDLTGLAKMSLTEAEVNEWWPSFLFLYDDSKDLQIGIQELEKIYTDLSCGYLINQYDQFEFLFHKHAELIGGMILEVAEMPRGVMHGNAWSLGVALTKEDYPESLLCLYEFETPVKFLGAK